MSEFSKAEIKNAFFRAKESNLLVKIDWLLKSCGDKLQNAMDTLRTGSLTKNTGPKLLFISFDFISSVQASLNNY